MNRRRPRLDAIADVREHDGHAVGARPEAGQSARGILQHAHCAGWNVAHQRHVVAPAVLDQPLSLAGEDRLAAARSERGSARRRVVIDVAVAFEQRAEDDAGVVCERQCPSVAETIHAEDSQSCAG